MRDSLTALDEVMRKIDQRGWSISIGVGRDYRVYGLYDVTLCAYRPGDVKLFEGGGNELIRTVTNLYHDALQWSRHQEPS